MTVAPVTLSLLIASNVRTVPHSSTPQPPAVFQGNCSPTYYIYPISSCSTKVKAALWRVFDLACAWNRHDLCKIHHFDSVPSVTGTKAIGFRQPADYGLQVTWGKTSLCVHTISYSQPHRRLCRQFCEVFNEFPTSSYPNHVVPGPELDKVQITAHVLSGSITVQIFLKPSLWCGVKLWQRSIA